jgi:glycosyltransferase involved in cell wall biosynthesis
VSIAGVWLDELGAQRDRDLSRDKPWRFEAIVDLRRRDAQSLWVRLRTRAAREVYSRWGRCLPDVLGYGATLFLRHARKAAADLTIVHSEAGLWVGCQLLNSGCKVGVDFEDWFSQDLLPDARAARPIAWLERLERRLAKDCVYSVTTSKALANAIAADYQAPAPEVVYNVFPVPDASREYASRDRQSRAVPSIHWFSQTIGPGRGLELLFLAAGRIDVPFEMHLRGTLRGDTADWLRAVMPAVLRDRVLIHDTVPNDELLERIAEHDIGVALETTGIRSSDLTISNKLFQYLHAGLAVVATDTTGQREVFAQTPEIGLLVADGDAAALQSALTTLLTDRERLERAKAAALAASRDHYAWELQRPVVEALARKALGGRP